MKIILDESAPQKLRLLIEGQHTVATTWYQGWSGLNNGKLLNAAEAAGFELLITADQELTMIRQDEPSGGTHNACSLCRESSRAAWLEP